MSLTVQTTYGPVEGRDKDGVFLFAGIPYAAPPVGSRRFKAPEPPGSWSETRVATNFSPAAPQIPSGGMTDNAPVKWDEDCLYLNVSTPALDDARRPVLVWIHGGGHRTGQGAIPWYSGASFARLGDIVTVSINYRLGALGFTDLSRFGEEYATSGANGTMDQICALAWVRDNIASFGGDPDKITIAGESAGGFSVATVMASPLAAGMFRGAIPQSGAAHHTLTREAAAKVTDLFLEELGADSIDALHAASVDDILAAQARVDKRAQDPAVQALLRGVAAFYPAQGTPAVPIDPLEAIRAGQAADARVLIGTNKDEATLLQEMSDEKLASQAKRFGSPALVDAYRARYPGANATELAIAMSTDQMFRVPCVRLAEAREENPASKGKTWMYRFDWESRGRLKSTHALEIPFAFNNLDKPGVAVFLGEGPKPQGVADVMHKAWIDFVRDGNPGWKAYDLVERTNMRFDEVSSPVADPDDSMRQAWEGIR
ncbi:MAG: carboxylesterase/lipase family protein [Pseudomonadales bacterium]|nr:carboxylesterase/lipase family protein [Pseudomonadales bacterium]